MPIMIVISFFIIFLPFNSTHLATVAVAQRVDSGRTTFVSRKTDLESNSAFDIMKGDNLIPHDGGA
jgi:hypothetical protein